MNPADQAIRLLHAILHFVFASRLERLFDRAFTGGAILGVHAIERGRAHVSLSGQINTITLTVKDSGPGFDPHEAMRGPGLGLTSMKERLKGVGGQLSIHSQRGHGTTIHAVAPLCLPTKSTDGVV